LLSEFKSALAILDHTWEKYCEMYEGNVDNSSCEINKLLYLWNRADRYYWQQARVLNRETLQLVEKLILLLIIRVTRKHMAQHTKE
jgi:hypothetical protein